MRSIFSIGFLIILGLGSVLGFQCFNLSKEIFSGKERSMKVIIKNAAFWGISTSLIFFGLVYFSASIFDHSFEFEIVGLCKSFLLFLIFGLIVFIGLMYQYFQVGVFRDLLVRTIKDRGRKDLEKKEK